MYIHINVCSCSNNDNGRIEDWVRAIIVAMYECRVNGIAGERLRLRPLAGVLMFSKLFRVPVHATNRNALKCTPIPD